MISDKIRAIIAEIEGAKEAPHHHLVSFRINNTIFASMPEDGSFLNIFVDPQEREKLPGMYPDYFKKVWWGKKVVGLRICPEQIETGYIEAFLRSACIFKAQ